MVRPFFLAFFFAFTASIFAQPIHPASGWIYDQSSVSRIDISINSDSLAQLLDPLNAYSDHEYPADMVFTRNGQPDTVLNVGFRLRGNTSRVAAKKSFKISINTFVSGRRYQGVKDMNLNGEHNDPSISRSRICWNLGVAEAMPVSRSSHTELYINGVYKGLYINIEHLNDDWLGLRFGNSNGNLYKCTWPANLNFISTNPNDYKLLNGNGTRVYELKTNETQDDYSGLAHFIDVLNNTPANQLECALDQIFNIEGYMQALAFEVTAGHWDNYSFNKNNYYLYENPETGKIEYLPYDIDNSMGVDWFNINWATRNANNWGSTNAGYLPLSERLLALPQLNEIYKFYLSEINQKFGNATFINGVDSIYNQIKIYAEADTFKALDYGFTNLDFKNSFDSTQAQLHVKMGIKTYINQRAASTTAQLGTFNTAPIIRDVKLAFLWPVTDALVTAFVADETALTVLCTWSLNGGSPVNTPLFDDGNHNDGAAGDGTFGGMLSNLTSGSISYQVTATDATNKTRTRPCNAKTVAIPTAQALVINEFMADNDAVYQDDFGDYNDWIELYNNTNDSIFLGDFYLTDDATDPTQFKLPTQYLAAHDYKIIWASDEGSKGPDHANFKLSKSGEEIGLFYDDGTSVDTADFILFGAQTTDVSYGRQYDASPVWVFFTSSTPNFSNYPLSVPEESKIGLKLYPNPYKNTVVLENPTSEVITVNVYIALGQQLFSTQILPYQTLEWQDENAAGLRIFELISGRKTEVVKLLTY